MKKIIFFTISAAIGVVLFVGVIIKVGPASIWQSLNYFSIGKWFIVLLLYTFQFLLTLYRWKIILRSQGFEVRMMRLAGSKLVGYTIDYLTPSPNVGGEAIRAYVLKKDTNVPFSPGLASVIIDKVMDFSYALPFVLFGIFYVLFKFTLSWKVIAGLLFVSIVFIFLLSLFFYRMFRNKEFFGSIIRFLQLHRLSFVARAMGTISRFEQIIITFFQRDKRVFYRGLVISFLGGASVVFALWLILIFLGIGANLLDVLIISTLTVITFLLPIPGSFGGTETGVALIFSILGFRPQEGVAYTLIFRSVDLMKIAFGLLFLSHFGLKIGQTIVKGQGFRDDNDQYRIANNQTSFKS